MSTHQRDEHPAFFINKIMGIQPALAILMIKKENPLILIDQLESAGGEALWRLIPFEEKAFGMYKDKHDVYDLLNPDQDT